MDEKQWVDQFMQGKITAEELVAKMSERRPEPERRIDLTEPEVPKSLIKAQAAIKRIRRGV